MIQYTCCCIDIIFIGKVFIIDKEEENGKEEEKPVYTKPHASTP